MKLYYLLVVGSLTVFCACESSSKRDAKSKTQEVPNERIANHQWVDDSLFIQETYKRGLMEIEMAKLADSTSNSQDIKAFAKTIENDYVKINSQLTDLAVQKRILLPDSLVGNWFLNYNELTKLKHERFDKKYIELTTQSLKVMTKNFEKKIKEQNADQGLKKIISEWLPTFPLHHKESVRINERLDRL